MDQLKLSIDSIHLPPGDVGALLAAFRYRLEPRLATAEVALDWAVDRGRAGGAPRRARHAAAAVPVVRGDLERGCSMAQARVLRLEARMEGTALALRVIDDGRGFDATRAPRSLAERAGAIARGWRSKADRAARSFSWFSTERARRARIIRAHVRRVQSALPGAPGRAHLPRASTAFWPSPCCCWPSPAC
jgi:hypothetical protein